MKLLAFVIFLLFQLGEGATRENLKLVLANATIPDARGYKSIVYDGEDSIYIIGGNLMEDLPTLRYSISNDVVSRVGNFQSIQSGSAVWTGARAMHYFGGSRLTGTTSAVLRINATTGAFQVVGNLPSALYATTPALDDLGRVYILGGYGTSPVDPVDTIIQYTTTTNTASMVARLPSRRYAATASYTSVDKNIYLFGGSTDNAGGPYLDEIVRFNPSTKVVTKLSARLPRKSGFSCSVSTGEYIYYIGGYNGTTARLTMVAGFDPITLHVEQLGLDTPFDNALFDPQCVYVNKLNRIYVSVGYFIGFVELY